jgi:riboflavin synthase
MAAGEVHSESPLAIAVVDTMFARVDMGSIAVDELSRLPGFGTRFRIRRSTVPGMKDLAVECKKLIEEEGCRIALALGMPGRADIDEVCAHEASQGIMLAQLMTNTHVLEVFVHEREASSDEHLKRICEDRVRKHALNAYWMLFSPQELEKRAGMGIRQGGPDVGPIQAT